MKECKGTHSAVELKETSQASSSFSTQYDTALLSGCWNKEGLAGEASGGTLAGAATLEPSKPTLEIRRGRRFGPASGLRPFRLYSGLAIFVLGATAP